MEKEQEDLINRVWEIADHYNSSAKVSAIEAVRKHGNGDEKPMEKAREYVAMNDDRQAMAKAVVEAIHGYWHKEAANAKS